MKSLFLFVAIICPAIAMASPARKVFCEDLKYKNLVTADISRGSLTVTDVTGREINRLSGLTVTIKRSGKFEVVQFKNYGVDNDLPRLVFQAKVDAFGDGVAKSFDDWSGATTSYQCGVRFLDL